MARGPASGSHTRIERVDSSNYREFESFHIIGSYAKETIELPYTFVASRAVLGTSYPFAIKPNAAPQVPAGDTLLVQQGRVVFRMKA